MVDYIGSLENLLSELKNYRQSVKNELRRYPDGRLMLWKQRGTLYKMHCTHAEGDRMRKGISGDELMVRKLARKEYLQQQLAIVNDEISALTTFIKRRVPGDSELIAPDLSKMPELLKLMPKYFEELPYEYFLTYPGPLRGKVKTPNPVNSLDIPIQHFAHRITAMTHSEWFGLPYRRNSYPLTGSTVTLQDGLIMRSKTEASILNVYKNFLIPFHYDEVIDIFGHLISPDFIGLDRDFNLIYHEHAGIMDDPIYAARHKEKMDLYESAGIVPWKNLIVTYELPGGGVDLRLVEAEIRAKYKI